MNGILAATLMVGGTGLLIGILLGIAGKKFYVEVDERETKVREARATTAAAAVTRAVTERRLQW